MKDDDQFFTLQVYQSNAYVPVTTTQYQTPSVGANTVSNSNTAGYQAYNQQPYQSSVTTFTQSSGAYQSAAQSVNICVLHIFL